MKRKQLTGNLKSTIKEPSEIFTYMHQKNIQREKNHFFLQYTYVCNKLTVTFKDVDFHFMHTPYMLKFWKTNHQPRLDVDFIYENI